MASTHFTYSPNALETEIKRTFRSGQVPAVWGSPGVGKSFTVAKVAQDLNLCLIQKRAVQMQPEDVGGFGVPDMATGRLKWLTDADWPLDTDPLPINPATGEPYTGWLVFIDEANQGAQAVMAALYQPILDHMVGNRRLHPKCRLAVAGNLSTDGAITNKIGTAMMSRLVHFVVELDHKEFAQYMVEAGFDQRVRGYLAFKPDHVQKFDPKTTEYTFACPRTWQFVSDYLIANEITEVPSAGAIAARIGDGVAAMFVAYCEQHAKCPKYEDIIASPTTVKLPDEPSMTYAVTTMMGDSMDAATFPQAVKYLTRLPAEYQTLAALTATARDITIKRVPAFHQWVVASGLQIFGK
jgi:hypothetical protein